MSTSVPANRNEKRIHHPHLLLAVQAGGRRLLGLPFLIPIMAPLLKRGGQWHSAPGPSWQGEGRAVCQGYLWWCQRARSFRRR
jgi:hypothetical protein